MVTRYTRIPISPTRQVHDAVERAALLNDKGKASTVIGMLEDHLRLMQEELQRVPLTLKEAAAAAEVVELRGPTVTLATAGDTDGPQATMRAKVRAAGPSADYAVRYALAQWLAAGGARTAAGYRKAGLSIIR